jgi:hypothetical protein
MWCRVAQAAAHERKSKREGWMICAPTLRAAWYAAFCEV